MPKRKAITKKTRFEVFKRDGFSCQYCGATPPNVLLQVDHIDPVAKGGGNEIENLVTSCQPCNIGKGANKLTNVPQSLKDKAADIREREAQIEGYAKVMRKRKDRIDEEVWQVARQFCDGFNKKNSEGYRELYKAQFESIKRFNEKLGVWRVEEAMEIALGSGANRREKGCFKYFCAVCWNWIREDEE